MDFEHRTPALRQVLADARTVQPVDQEAPQHRQPDETEKNW